MKTPSEKSHRLEPEAQVSPYIDKQALAHRMGITRRTVDNWLQRGLPHLKLGSRRVRFDLREVDDWFRAHCRVVRRGKLSGDGR